MGKTGNERQAQKELIQLIVARVWVRGQRVTAISLRPNYHVILGLESEKPTILEVDSVDCNIVLNRERRDLYQSQPSDYFHQRLLLSLYRNFLLRQSICNFSSY